MVDPPITKVRTLSDKLGSFSKLPTERRSDFINFKWAYMLQILLRIESLFTRLAYKLMSDLFFNSGAE